jgi:hypothetical protein
LGEQSCPPFSIRNAISADGSRAFWTRQSPGIGRQLLARLDGAQTIQLDKTQGGVGPAGDGEYLTAAEDGSAAYFSAPGKLVPGAGKGGLYRYDLEATDGKPLTLLTPGPQNAEVLGLLGASEDAKRLYFTARGAYDPQAAAGEPNLYLWEEGAGLRFIATLAAADRLDWAPNWEEHTAAANPAGTALAFTSTAPLTGYDNTDQETGEPDPQVYLYDATTDTLRCASCNPTGARPTGPSALPGWSTPYQQPRYLSAEGHRLFFTSKDAIDLNDENEAADVYQFELAGTGGCTSSHPTYVQPQGGCIDLISSGRDPKRSVLIDASADGADVFFATVRPLVAQDEDERFDIYDARIGGGFPPPSPPPAPCTTGEECRSPAPGSPPAAAPGTSAFSGPGTTPPRRRHCKRGFARKGGKCVRKPKKQHHKHHGKHKPKHNGRPGI